jgi:hypothetical protein
LMYILASVSVVGTVNSKFRANCGLTPSSIRYWMRVTYFSSMFLVRLSMP